MSVLALLYFPFGAGAWEYKEHRNVCYSAYHAACEALEGEVADDAGANRRFERACGRDGVEVSTSEPGEKKPRFSQDARNQIGLSTRHSLASRFGEACAIAADHVGSPARIMSEFAYADDTWGYLALASENADHFHPVTAYRYGEFFESALEHATKGHDSPASEEIAFTRAFYHAAFACHHLADAHATGHMGFQRRHSGATVSGRYHAKYNKKGRTVRDLRGNVWSASGDGHICEPDDKVEGNRLLGARLLDEDFPPIIEKHEDEYCGPKNSAFRHVARNTYFAVREILTMYSNGGLSDDFQPAGMYMPHDLWHEGRWESSINWRPVRTANMWELNFRRVPDDDFGTFSTVVSHTSHLGLSTNIFRARYGLGVVSLGPSIWNDHEDLGRVVTGAEATLGVIFNPDLSFSVFTPELFVEGRALYAIDQKDFEPVPGAGLRVMIEAFHLNLAPEIGGQWMNGDWSLMLNFGIGFLTGIDGSDPNRTLAIDDIR